MATKKDLERYFTYAYKPYMIIDEVCYYRVGQVAKIINRTVQTIRLWEKWSDELESQGKQRLIPRSTRIGEKTSRCWTTDEVKQIIKFSKNLKYGDIAQFSRTRWGKRQETLTEDRSTEVRKQRQQELRNKKRKLKLQKRQEQVKKLKAQKKHLLKTVRSKASNIYKDLENLL